MPAHRHSIGWTMAGHEPVQTPADVAVIMPTIVRPALGPALRSVFQQRFSGRIQVLVGVDRMLGDPAIIDEVMAERPDNVSVLLLNLPWSTSKRHGGVHLPGDGGSLRSILSYMANAHYVAYLDDDNAWLPDHLQQLHAAAQGKLWAFAHRMLVDGRTNTDIAHDRWDSVGPDKGRFAERGGFVDPNCLMVNKLQGAQLFGLWAETGTGKVAMTADRNFFRGLRQRAFGEVVDPTVRYFLRPDNILWRVMEQDGVDGVTGPG